MLKSNCHSKDETAYFGNSEQLYIFNFCIRLPHNNKLFLVYLKILFIVVEVFPAKKKLKQKTFCKESFYIFDNEMQTQIESLSIIHGDIGVIFLQHVKAIMVRLTMKDWVLSLSEQIMELAECVIKYETLSIFKTFESLERFDVNEEIEITEHICSQSIDQWNEEKWIANELHGLDFKRYEEIIMCKDKSLTQLTNVQDEVVAKFVKPFNEILFLGTKINEAKRENRLNAVSLWRKLNIYTI
ncbi:hypothetical protein RFI_21644 [Reticulomyxa filosa]|uniref:Uncharacterized protein n=1 Tax=Reticulomyxa filosa TaxID=46433 RepID=X6MRJ0_RETFI|nr:hypothetical protein RFI_21644 [Reticulomyxa filosa]|eukprot:ETO15720.1 hypothetical protein RFI_21644 [Reticulomyxa filosa]